MKKIELLIPVGNMECLKVAVHYGADAVYLGGKKFGARAYSNNFTNDEMIEAIRYCHLYGVKIYVTVNTMIYNEEVKEFITYLHFLYTNGVDAVIMQDVGMITLARKLLPNLEVHISTQAHNHNESGVNYYKTIGCTRVVFDRESSLESIKEISVPIEKEVFVYGALCVCYSGNCLFSALNGGRSANRGMCVGSCRLPYTLVQDKQNIRSGYLLSTKDLFTINHLKELLDSSIDSLKIEGRMKSKEYVAVVTKIYRKLIDQYYQGEKIILDEEDKKNLLKTYNREFSEGYLFSTQNIINSKTSNHQGIKIGTVIGVTNKRVMIQLDDTLHQEDAIRFAKVNKGMFVNSLYNSKGLLISNANINEIIAVDNKEHITKKDLLGSDVLKTVDFLLNKELQVIHLKKIPIYMTFQGWIGKKVSLTVSDGIHNVIEVGNVVEKAKTTSIEKERIKEQLSKLGSTPFCIESLEVFIDDNLFINIKEINILRRNACNKLVQLREGQVKSDEILTIPSILPIIAQRPKISILTRNEEQLIVALRNKLDIIYTTSEKLYEQYKYDSRVYLRLERVLEKHKIRTNERFLCTEFGSIVQYGKNNQIRSDYYLNVANDYTLEEFKRLDTSSVTLSVENTVEQLSLLQNKKSAEIIVYGTLECMIIKNNIFNIEEQKTEIVDEKGNRYVVIYEKGFTHIFHHSKIDLLSKLNYLKGFGYYRIELFQEGRIETQNIINKLKSMLK